MPFIDFKTNVSVSREQCEKLKSRFGADITALGKSEPWLMVNVQGECSLFFKGSDKPAAIAEVALFGRASSAQYDAMTEKLCAAVAEELGIDSGRIYVKYEETEHWGVGGFNF